VGHTKQLTHFNFFVIEQSGEMTEINVSPTIPSNPFKLGIQLSKVGRLQISGRSEGPVTLYSEHARKTSVPQSSRPIIHVAFRINVSSQFFLSPEKQAYKEQNPGR
jgi:hypothetical protein